MTFVSTVWKGLRKLSEQTFGLLYTPIGKIKFFLNGVTCGQGFRCSGTPKVYVTRRGKVTIGSNFRVNSGSNHNIIGRQGRAIFWVEGTLSIGDNVGLSNSALICRKTITIENNVILGGNCVIYDTDFHPIDPDERLNKSSDLEQASSSTVHLEKNVFVGAHSTILKGVTIGENSVIGACSLVAKNVPANEVWAGNPARRIGNVK